MKSTTNKPPPQPTMYETENDIPKSARAELKTLINQRLADVIDLQLQLKDAHWNVKGPNFIGLHELFDKIAEEVESYVDEIAERVVQLGGIAQGTTRFLSSETPRNGHPSVVAVDIIALMDAPKIEQATLAGFD